ILSRMPHSPSGASARPSPHVSIKSLELNALHTSQIQDMVHLNGNRSKIKCCVDRLSWLSKADNCGSWNVRSVPCVDGSELARAFFTFAALVGAAMCSAFK